MKLYYPSLLFFALVSRPALSFAPSPQSKSSGLLDDDLEKIGVINLPSSNNIENRRQLLNAGAFVFGAFFGMESGPQPALSAEEKVYSTNARNMMRLSNGDASGGSAYDNNPSSTKARMRRAMVGCKSSAARSVAGESIGMKNFSEKECNMEVMNGRGAGFMLEALTQLDCPTCPYGIGSR
mmetsp:Transcript_28374/g.59683  ORF Transcript_28374/g.59683 Transcript_28374/m.59683 type:complete len:181 (+) Transcript_28374:164-706(+)